MVVLPDCKYGTGNKIDVTDFIKWKTIPFDYLHFIDIAYFYTSADGTFASYDYLNTVHISLVLILSRHSDRCWLSFPVFRYGFVSTVEVRPRLFMGLLPPQGGIR